MSHSLSDEIELMHVSTDPQVADIFTKPLGLDKLRHFSSMLGLQHIDTENLMGKNEEEERDKVRKTDTYYDYEFDFGPIEEVGVSKKAEEAMDMWTNGRRLANSRIAKYMGRTEPTEPRGQRAEKGKKGGKLEQTKVDRVKSKTKTWADVVNVLEVEESKAPDSVKNQSEYESIDSIKMIDLEESNQWAKRERRLHPKLTPIQRTQWVKRRLHGSNGEAEEGQGSREANHKGRGAQNQKSCSTQD